MTQPDPKPDLKTDPPNPDPPQPPPPPPPDPPKGPEGDPPEGQPWDPERAKRTIEAQRASEKAAKDHAKQLQEQLDAANAKIKERTDADLSETERLKKEAADAKAEAERVTGELRISKLRSEVINESIALKIVDPDVAFRLLDQSEVTDEKGEPKDVKAALEKLIKDKPYLIKAEDSRSGPPPTPRPDGKGADAELLKAASEQTRRAVGQHF